MQKKTLTALALITVLLASTAVPSFASEKGERMRRRPKPEITQEQRAEIMARFKELKDSGATREEIMALKSETLGEYGISRHAKRWGKNRLRDKKR